MVEVAATATGSAREFSHFEKWPDWLFYTPVLFIWIYFAIRYRGPTLPAITNTAPALSGFLGESKTAAFALLGPKGRTHLPPYAIFTTRGECDAADNKTRADAALRLAGLQYPFVGKPDIGQNGAGVRIVREPAAFAAWLSTFPRETKLILQKYIDDEGEAGVFYVRYPYQSRGRIVSLTLKYLPHVTGDGVATLRELILNDARARSIAHLYFVRHAARLDSVVPKGEHVRLVSVGNHCMGAIFKDGADHITPRMEAAFDAVAKEMPGFFFGRFDVRFRAIGELERGEEFVILEVNGADSEMTHIWDADETILGAYRTLYRQYRMAFEIAAYNRARGAQAVSVARFIASWWQNRARLRGYTREE